MNDNTSEKVKKLKALSEELKAEIEICLSELEHADAIIKENKLRDFITAIYNEVGATDTNNVEALSNEEFIYLCSRMTEEQKDEITHLVNDARLKILAIDQLPD